MDSSKSKNIMDMLFNPEKPFINNIFSPSNKNIDPIIVNMMKHFDMISEISGCSYDAIANKDDEDFSHVTLDQERERDGTIFVEIGGINYQLDYNNHDPLSEITDSPPEISGFVQDLIDLSVEVILDVYSEKYIITSINNNNIQMIYEGKPFILSLNVETL